MTYTLSTTPLSRIAEDGTGLYALSDSAYGPVICYMRFTPEDADFWSRLLNSQAEKAWEEGVEAKSEHPDPTNPYTIQEREEPREKTTHCPHSHYAPRCVCSTAPGH